MTPRPVGIYLPDNPALAVLDCLPGHLSRYSEHARLLLHFILTKLWTGDVDDGGFARLWVAILRDYIPGAVLAPLKRELKNRGVIELAGYSAGFKSTGYRIGADFDGRPVRHVLTDARLADRVRTWRESAGSADGRADRELEAVREARGPVLRHIRDSVLALSLPDWPDAVAEAAVGEGANLEHCLYVAQVIVNGDADAVTVDSFGFRVHHILTRTPRALRRRMLLGGLPLAEVDVANAQPLLLGLLLALGSPYICCAQDIGVSPPLRSAPLRSSPLFAGVKARPKQSELADYLRLCEAGQFYDALAKDMGCTRDEAKDLVFKEVFFGRATVNGRATQAFARRWPSLLEVLRECKRRNGYKAVAKGLQRLESEIMIDRVCPRLCGQGPGRLASPFLTIHDALAVVSSQAEASREVIRGVICELGVTPKIKIDGPAPAAGPSSGSRGAAGAGTGAGQV